MLRRTLSDIPNDLPDIVRIPMPIELEATEAALYEERRKTYIEDGATLGAIGKLVTDLALKKEQDRGISDLKYEYLNLVCKDVFANNEKIIVFADKLKAIGELEKQYSKIVPTFSLTGEVPISNRQQIIDEYSSVDGPALLIVNPSVGGAGLNITAANHLLHFSPQWNPAKIDQADARAHRNGQHRTVFAHYPYYVGTIEEYMWEKVYFKRELSKRVVVGNKGEVSTNDIVDALNMSPVIGRE